MEIKNVQKDTLRMLVINPNSTKAMTDALKPMVHDLGYDDLDYTFFTCPSPGVPSINSPSDAAKSAELCWPSLHPLLPHHDAFLVACYSQHPLVPILREACSHLESSTTGTRKYVTGIFEASVTASLSLLSGMDPTYKFGIVSTEKVWATALPAAVDDFLNSKYHYRPGGGKFLCCETTGLSAVELEEMPKEEVRRCMVEATERLARWGEQAEHYGRNLGVVCLGCAGMVGLEEAVRQGCVNVMGEVEGGKVRIVDGVKAGVGQLVAIARGGF